MNNGKKQRGVTLIAAIFIIVVLAFMGVMFLSLVSTSSFTSVNDLRSEQSLNIAEGGLEFDQRSLAQNLDWYRSVTDPIATTIRNLGSGAFTVSTTLPATKLRRRLQAGDNTVQVYTTDRFLNAGFLQIDENIGGGAEFVQYTGKTANSFTGVTRGRQIGTIATAAAAHPRGSNVYPATTLTGAGLISSCVLPITFTITQNDKFLGAGILDIEGEEIGYTGSSVAGGIMTLTGVQRCLGAVTFVAHGVNQPVTPILVGGDTADYQAEIASTGTVGTAVRMMRKTVQR